MSLFSTISNADILGGAPSGSTKPLKQGSDVSFGEAMSAVDKFMKYQEMTQPEKIRASYLASKGLTEEDLANLSPEEQQKIEEEILDAMKRKLGVKEVRSGDVG